MPDQIYIGNFAKGLKLDREPFNIDNDAFPTLSNAYTWRGRVLRKRGTSLLGQLRRQIESVLNATPPASWQIGQITLTAGAGNLFSTDIIGITQATNAVVTVTSQIFIVGQEVSISGVTGMTEINGGPYTIVARTLTTITLDVNSTAFGAYVAAGQVFYNTNSSIVPGSISVVVGANTYTDPLRNGILFVALVESGTINYVTGAITISGGGAGPITGRWDYFPELPVLGLEDFIPNDATSDFPLLIAFDRTYAYQINQSGTPFFYSVSYYKNSNNPVEWSNFDYAQFWSTNYQNAFWVTNNKPGFHYATVTVVGGTGVMTFTDPNTGLPVSHLVVGDVVWFNEWATSPQLNGASATVFTVIDAATGQYLLSFPASVVGPFAGSGIGVLLTASISGQDGIRWYDGDPTAGTGLPSGTPSSLPPSTSFVNKGWVNFSPPLTATTVAFDDMIPAQYYLVGALMIVPFKDRLLFLGPMIQAVGGPVIQQSIEDVVIWSWNGTPYYTALVPTGTNIFESYDVRSYYVDQTGFGGYLPAGVSKPIKTVADNEEVLLIGFGGTGLKTRFVYTGNDLQPFLFYLINSEYPSTSTFSSITFDKSGADVGAYGITMTTQQSCERVDLDIPDQVFDIQALNNGQERVNSARDFYREWVYFTYPTGSGEETQQSWVYPDTTLLWNYRENTWGICRENYTHQGTYRKATYYTWDTLPVTFGTWDDWNEPWNDGSNVALFPSVIAGNPQGYVLIKDVGTGEAVSGSINNISDDGNGMSQISSVNHCVNINDYISFQGDSIGKVTDTPDADNFVVDIPFPSTATITAATQSTSAVLTLSWPIPAQSPQINSYFVGQRISIAGVVGMTQLNGNTYTIIAVTPTTITLAVDSTGFTTYVSGGTTTLVSYIGTGKYVRLSQPLIMTKQFPVYWQEGRQVRVGTQKYLLDYTDNAQVTVVIALSQDGNTAWNQDPVVPDINTTNSGLVYTQILYTCPESTNLGLTPANVNLQMPTANTQRQIWHRMNTSLIGDTFQVGITLSDLQMRDLDYATSEISLHGIQMTVDRGPQTC